MTEQPNATAQTVDANLLPALQALLEERNLTHAGARLMMSQPAMSGALARLRRHFDDELLVRSGRDFELTPFAKELQTVVARAVESAARILATRPFDPATTSRTFSVTLSEYAMTVLAEPLLTAITARSADIDITFDPIPADIETLTALLLRRDLLVAPVGSGVPGQRQPVFTDEFVCITSTETAAQVRGRLSLHELSERPFAVARFGPNPTHLTPDEVKLRQLGVQRRVVTEVPSLLALPFAVSGTDLFAFVPRRLLRQCADILDLAVIEIPGPRVEMIEAAHWHPQRKGDPALSWLRTILHDVAVTLESVDVPA